MRRFHLWVGVLTVLAFIITGQFIRHHQPPTPELGNDIRLMLRSRHIYVLASGLVNLMLGLYFEKRTGWRGGVQMAGSCLLALSPVLLLLAFAVEPGQGFQPEMWRSSAGLYLLFAGSMLHLIGARPRSM